MTKKWIQTHTWSKRRCTARPRTRKSLEKAIRLHSHSSHGSFSTTHPTNHQKTFLCRPPAGAHRKPHSPSAVPVSESGLPQRRLSGRPASHHAGRRQTQTQRQLLWGRAALQTRKTDGTSQYGELVHLRQVHYSPLRVLVWSIVLCAPLCPYRISIYQCHGVFAIVNVLWLRSLIVILSVICVHVCFAVIVNRMSYCTEHNDKRLRKTLMCSSSFSLYQFFLPCGSIYLHRGREKEKYQKSDKKAFD